MKNPTLSSPPWWVPGVVAFPSSASITEVAAAFSRVFIHVVGIPAHRLREGG